MVSPNISKRFSWMYEVTAGTTLFDAVNDVTYYFGVYNDDVKKWNYPTITNKIVEYHTYNTRNPTLVNAGATMPPFVHTYIPTSAQHLVWQKGGCTDAAPDTFQAADYNKVQFGLDQYMNNLASIYIVGNGRLAAFEILLPISYFLIISPVFLVFYEHKNHLLLDCLL